MKQRGIVGDLINFRGMVYAPLNENGVIFLFGKVMEDLNMYVEEIKPGFPDCIGRRFNGRGWELVRIEFEFKSSNFVAHEHNPRNCDIIVCWEHDWPECRLEVIELKDVIKGLPTKSPKRPDIEEDEEDMNIEIIEADNQDMEDLYEKDQVSEKVKDLFETFNKEIKSVNDEIWSKVGKRSVTYYSPERVFIYSYFFMPDKIRFNLFTGKGNIDGVDKRLKALPKWGVVILESEEEIPKVVEAAKKSYERIKLAIRANESSYS
ncbi:MAG: hypothetical protein FJ150_06895 [Euryarchaeota archaeon]|nr:hypothetical protein [Euryarchaeota archaeon]